MVALMVVSKKVKRKHQLNRLRETLLFVLASPPVLFSQFAFAGFKMHKKSCGLRDSLKGSFFNRCCCIKSSKKNTAKRGGIVRTNALT